ncbi:hypothetical protein CVT25_000445 [Psilocybe cyanescens]|uniref:Uncharacterized protein n=1 Tax=Psilocybe cyanescens TaxID=93625 RepID=A0A409XM63_PSICY|nr:hypothetical protein CVT25_000445 [Psilocybe cyanescens]
MRDIIDTKQKHPRVLDGLDKINKDTPADSVEKASRRIKKLYKKEGDNPVIAAQILRAMQNLERRIAPVFEQLANVEEINAQLQEELRVAKSSKSHYKEISAELREELRVAKLSKSYYKEINAQLQEELRVANSSKSNYREKVLKAKLEVEKEKEETKRQRKRADKYLTRVKEKKDDIQELLEAMEDQEMEIMLLEEAICV